MTEEDWQAAGNVLKRRKQPEFWQVAATVLAEASEEFEENVYRLLALFTIPNAVVKDKRREGTLPAYIDEVVEDLLDDASWDELMALAAIAGDVVDGAFRDKAREIGSGTLGKALRLVGLDPSKMGPQTPPSTAQTPPEEEQATHGTGDDPESTERPPSSKPIGSGSSPESSPVGPPTPSSTRPSSSSELSAIASSSTER